MIRRRRGRGRAFRRSRNGYKYLSHRRGAVYHPWCELRTGDERSPTVTLFRRHRAIVLAWVVTVVLTLSSAGIALADGGGPPFPR